MQDGRMTSLVTVQLFGPDGALKNTQGDCVCCDPSCEENCPDRCTNCPAKEESNG